MPPAAKVRLSGSRLRTRPVHRVLAVGGPCTGALPAGHGRLRAAWFSLPAACPPWQQPWAKAAPGAGSRLWVPSLPDASPVIPPHLARRLAFRRGVSFRPFYFCGRTGQQRTLSLLDSSHVVLFAVGFCGWPCPSPHLCCNLGVAGEESALVIHFFDNEMTCYPL